VVLAVRAPVDCEPLMGLLPDQPSIAIQPVALVVFQVRVDAPPFATVVGFAVKVSVGAGGVAVIVTVTERAMEPPVPEQLRLNVLSLVNAPVDCEPLMALLPDQAPEAVQLVALVLLQFSVEELPLVILVGLAVKVSVGARGAAVTATVADPETEPPLPVQLNVNVLLVVNAPVDCDPLTALAPDQAPEAVQLVTFVPFHVRVDAAPLATLVGLAVRVSAGAGGVLPPAPNTTDFNSQPSPPPALTVHAAMLLPPTAPKQTPIGPESGTFGLVVQIALEHSPMSAGPRVAPGQSKIFSVLLMSGGFFSTHCDG